MPHAHDRSEVVAAVIDVVSAHTGLRLPAPPRVLAVALLLDDAVFALSETATTIAVVDHVLAHIGHHIPHLARDRFEPPVSFVAELSEALCAS